jgi:protein-tyrosine phosphatase
MPDPTAEDGEVPQKNDSPQATSKEIPAFLKLSRNDIQSKFIDLEWQQRNRLAQGRQPDTVSQWALLSGDDIANRNRYANVEVFANNRVKLRVPEGHSDYINASPIKLQNTSSSRNNFFIATQGPKEGIHGHIWRMIWQECADTAVIVMLTQTHEAGREKCFQYFPADMENATMDITEDDEFDDDFKATLTLKSITEDPDAQSTVREMELKAEDGQTKTVWHLLFSGWPDFSIPEDESRDALVRLIQLSASKNTHSESPRVVHCSAGVGRSGTFIALDWLLAELEEGSLDDLDDDTDPVMDIVDELRQQRMMMVQSDSQYNFLYDLLRRLWKDRQEGRKPGEVDTKGLEKRSGIDMSRSELEQEMQGNVAESVLRKPMD